MKPIHEIASEAADLAGKASPAPWKSCGANDGKWCSCGLVWSIPQDVSIAACHNVECPDEQHSYGGYDHAQLTANQHLIAHAGTHYAALCRALLAQRADNAQLREALRDARQTIARPDYGGCNERIVFGKGFVHAEDCRKCEQEAALAKIDAALSQRGEKATR